VRARYGFHFSRNIAFFNRHGHKNSAKICCAPRSTQLWRKQNDAGNSCDRQQEVSRRETYCTPNAHFDVVALLKTCRTSTDHTAVIWPADEAGEHRLYTAFLSSLALSSRYSVVRLCRRSIGFQRDCSLICLLLSATPELRH